ncbi:MAG: bifunctional [glutamate--ammonia ligase]-adenylyl-L-tyrosine phosphorylase/[glutamate--ammonia-ligase] adenylyltransferase, partial [Gammaproteobacteria bacterium]
EILGRHREAQVLKHEVAEMRERMLKEHVQAGEGFDLKLDVGGLTDIEFLVQYWVLANAATHPALLDWTDNIRNLEGLVATGVLTNERGTFLADTYRSFRQIVHRRSLEGRTARIPENEAEPQRSQVRELWGTTIGLSHADET